MEDKKTLSERLENDILTDNSKIEYCKQCKYCIFKAKIGYNRGICGIYKETKPLLVVNNGSCEFYRKE